jgi:hypothetical protein
MRAAAGIDPNRPRLCVCVEKIINMLIDREKIGNMLMELMSHFFIDINSS